MPLNPSAKGTKRSGLVAPVITNYITETKLPSKPHTIARVHTLTHYQTRALDFTSKIASTLKAHRSVSDFVAKIIKHVRAFIHHRD